MSFPDYGETILECGCTWETGTWFPCQMHMDLDRERKAAIAAEFPSLAPLWYEVHGYEDASHITGIPGTVIPKAQMDGAAFEGEPVTPPRADHEKVKP